MNLDQIEKELNQVKRKSENTNKELQLQLGKKESVLERLKDFGIDSLEQAVKRKKELEVEQSGLFSQLEKIKTKVNNKYSEIFE